MGDFVERYARNANCREGGPHRGEEVTDVYDEPVAHICPKCLDRVMPVLNPRAIPGWPRQTLFYVDYEEVRP